MIISIFGEIGWDVSAQDVMKQIQACEDEKIKVVIASGGGSAFEGLMIYDALRASGKEIETVIMGLGASAASVIFMAGDVREMGDGALLMIHNSWSMFFGNAEEVRDQLGTLEAIDDRMLNIFMSNTDLSEEQLKEMLAAETWLNSGQAVEMGFATGEAESLNIAASINNLYKNKKEPLNMANEKQEVEATEEEKGLFAKFKSWLKSEPKAEDMPIDEEEKAEGDHDELEALKAENVALKAENVDLKEALEAAKSEKAEAAESSEAALAKACSENTEKITKILDAMSKNQILLSDAKELKEKSLEDVEAVLETKDENATGRGSEGEPKKSANTSHYDIYQSLEGAEKTAYWKQHKNEIMEQSKES